MRCLRPLLLIVFVDDARHKGSGLFLGRYAPMLIDEFRSGLISSKRLDKIEVVSLQQFAQVLCSPLGRNGSHIEFDSNIEDDRQQIWIEAIGGTRHLYSLIRVGKRGSGIDSTIARRRAGWGLGRRRSIWARDGRSGSGSLAP